MTTQCTFAEGRDQVDFSYLNDATNAVYALMAPPFSHDERDVARVLAIACRAMSRLEADPGLVRSLRLLTRRRHRLQAEFGEVTEHVDHFTRGFLVTEARVLRRAGLSTHAVDRLTAKAERLRGAIAQWEDHPAALERAVRAFSIEVCIDAQVAHLFLFWRKQERRYRRLLARTGYVFGGAAVVAINAGPIGQAYGLSAVGTAVSGAMGAALMGAGLAWTE